VLHRIKKSIRQTQYAFNDLTHYGQNVIRVHWSKSCMNFGDELNPILIEALTGKTILNIYAKYYQKEHLLAIGSVLDRATSNSIIWGSGFISEQSVLLEKPKKIYAVRGPETREKLIGFGIACPEIYGDPALLMPYVYQPKRNIDKKYKVGIIPHIVDKDNAWLKQYSNSDEIKIINLQNSNPLKVIDNILQCEKILSSSLHGIIVSDAYNVPSLWIKFSNNITGGNFKFLDYFLSVKRKDKEPIFVDNSVALREIMQRFSPYEIDINIRNLLNCLPYELQKNKTVYNTTQKLDQ
jgi:pyruvyltransferase